MPCRAHLHYRKRGRQKNKRNLLHRLTKSGCTHELIESVVVDELEPQCLIVARRRPGLSRSCGGTPCRRNRIGRGRAPAGYCRASRGDKAKLHGCDPLLKGPVALALHSKELIQLADAPGELACLRR